MTPGQRYSGLFWPIVCYNNLPASRIAGTTRPLPRPSLMGYILYQLLPQYFSSLALFAFVSCTLRDTFNMTISLIFSQWLRSSVVSVLFSLISENFLRKVFVINLIFFLSKRISGLAYVLSHRVTGLTLPSVDATLFIMLFGLSKLLEKKIL